MELQELKQKFLTQLIHDFESNKKLYFDLTIDEGTQPIFWAKGYVNAGYDENGNYQIWQVSIGEAGFQYPDFETTLDRKYISEIEDFCTE